jgi:hypothetical protein
MAMDFSVTTLTVPETALTETRYSSIEDALTGANFMLGRGAMSVWIVDRAAQTGWIAKSALKPRVARNRGVVGAVRLQSTSRLSNSDLNARAASRVHAD